MNRQAVLMGESNLFTYCFTIISGKATIREAEAVREMGDACKSSIPWAKVAVLQNQCMVSPETVTTFSLTYLFIVL